MKVGLAESRRVSALFAPHRARLLLVVGIIVVASLVSLSTPFLIREIIDVAIPQERPVLLSVLAVVMLAGISLTESLHVWQARISTTVGQLVIHRLRTAVYHHLQSLPLRFFTTTHAGDLQARIASDIGGLQTFVTTTAASTVTSVTTLLATVAAMLLLDWRLACVSLALLPAVLVVSQSVGRLRRQITQRRQEQMAALTSHVEESLSVRGVAAARTMGRSGTLAEEFTGHSAELADLDLRAAMTGRRRIARLSVLMSSLSVFLYWGAGLSASVGGSTLSIGTLVAFVTLQNSLLGPAMSLAQVGVQMHSSLALFTRVFEYLDQEPGVRERPGALSLPRDEVKGALALHAVHFRHCDDAEPAVHSLSLNIPAGSRIAIVGETGSGKSTVAQLLVRLHDPTRGRVTLDGHDLKDLTFKTLSDAIAVVPQDPYLVHASIADNLRMAKPDATDHELSEACLAAGIHARVLELPDGYASTVGAGGQQLSGGEKQRIALARALLRDARVLVLDEATSALDTRTEHRIQRSLARLAEDRTVVTIAHRLSTVRHADGIAVLHRGRLVEFGTHDELLAADGAYGELWALMQQTEAVDH